MSEHLQMSESEKKKEDWMNSKWRPMMGWLYMGVCAFDFVLFPIMWSLLQAIMKVGTITQWQPLTLQGAGLFHIAMGAVLGIAALGRTQEKLAGANNGGLQQPSGFSVPSPTPSSFQAPASTGFGNPVATASVGGSGFGGAPMPTPTSSFGGGFGAAKATPVMASNGKLGPAPQEDPVL